jgi:integrase
VLVGGISAPILVSVVLNRPKSKESSGQFEGLVAKLPAHLQPYVTFLYFCGGRSGEAELIEWMQVDLARGIIRLEDDQTKNDEARYVPLPKRLVLMLAATDPKRRQRFRYHQHPKGMDRCLCGSGPWT